MTDPASALSTSGPVSQFISTAGDTFTKTVPSSLPTPAPTPAALSPNTASNTIMVVLVLAIVLLLIAVIMLACSFVLYRRSHSRDTAEHSPEIPAAASLPGEPRPHNHVDNKKNTGIRWAKWLLLFLGLLASSIITTAIYMNGQRLGGVWTALIFAACMLPYWSVRQKYKNRKHLEEALKDQHQIKESGNALSSGEQVRAVSESAPAESKSANAFRDRTFDDAEPKPDNSASVFKRTSDDIVQRKSIELREAKRKVRRAFIRTLAAPPLLNLVYDIFTSTDFFLRHYIKNNPEYSRGYYNPSLIGLVFFNLLPQILNICLLFAWLPFALRLFSHRNKYRNLAGKSDSFIFNALYAIGVCVLAFAVNFIFRGIMPYVIMGIRFH